MRRFALISGVSLLVAAGVIALAIGADVHEFPVNAFWAYALACLVSFEVQLGGALLARHDQELPARTLRAIRVRAIVIAVATTAIGALFGDLSPSAESGLWCVMRDALTCSVRGVGVALVPVVLALWALRGRLSAAQRAVATEIGGAAAALAGFVLHLSCTARGLPHVALVHGGLIVLPTVLVGTLGALVLRRAPTSGSTISESGSTISRNG